MGLLEAVPLRSPGRMRWTARILGLLLALVVLLVGIGEAVVEPSWDPVGIGVGGLMLWVAASMALAWRWEKLGGLSGVLTGLAVGIFVAVTAQSNKAPAALLMGLPVLVIGVAFLFAARQSPVSRNMSGG